MAENNNEVAKVAINDIGTEEDFIKAVDSTIKNFDDGDLVEGTVVKVDHDEVLLDIGYKTEGVIPSRELSIKKDVDPDEVVEVGDTIEALVVTKEDKEGRLILSKKRAPLIRIDLHRPSTLLNRNKRSFSASQSLFGYYQFVNLLYQIKTICQDIFREANIRIRL